MKLFDVEYEIRRMWDFERKKWFYTIWQRNKFLWWGNWGCLCNPKRWNGVWKDCVLRYRSLEIAEQGIPKGSKIVGKPLK